MFFLKKTFYKSKRVTKQIKPFYIYSIVAVSLSWEEAVTKCDLNLLTSYENPVIVLNEIETNTDIKGYHTYMNS